MEPDDLLSRATRGLRRPSLDARSEGQSGGSPGGDGKNGKGRLDGLLCSRNAHGRNVLVRRTQSRIDQAALEN